MYRTNSYFFHKHSLPVIVYYICYDNIPLHLFWLTWDIFLQPTLVGIFSSYLLASDGGFTNVLMKSLSLGMSKFRNFEKSTITSSKIWRNLYQELTCLPALISTHTLGCGACSNFWPIYDSNPFPYHSIAHNVFSINFTDLTMNFSLFHAFSMNNTNTSNLNNTNYMTCHHHLEIAIQFILSSRHHPGINLR